jgi:hypothetical protein
VPRLPAGVALLLISLVLTACSAGGTPAPTPEHPTVAVPSPTQAPATETADDALVGKPQNRASIGDVERAFLRYETTRSDMIATFRDQPWFKDGLTRDESLFVERSITFVASYSGPRRAYVSDETIQRKLYRYERVPYSQGEIELLLIYEPGQDVEREMLVLKSVIPALEKLIGVEYPERVMTVVNGAFEINDYNDGQFIRIARCCYASASVLAHEMSHTYWSMGPSWFNEGMADIYSVLVNDQLNRDPPPGWRTSAANLDDYYRQRKAAVDSRRFPDIALPRRLASDGLYEVADVFLIDLRRLLGVEAFNAAVKEIYLASDFGRYNLKEKRIQDTFMKHATAEARATIMTMFNRTIWGDNGERYRQLQELEGP